jgi:probable F420-dependent oxidoreductase
VTERSTPVRLGLRIPFGPDLAALRTIAERAEAAGFDSVWAGDHLAWFSSSTSRYPYSSTGEMPLPPDAPFFDLFVLLGHLAAATSRLRLCTGVYILPLRPAIVTARAAATADLASDGRLTLGVGAGWLREEFDAVGVPFEERGVRTDETIGALRALWGPSPSRYDGTVVAVPPMHLEPKPRQGESLPIHVGGETPRALERAAALGDGWVAMRQTPEAVAGVVARLHERRAELGRDGHGFEVSVSTGWPCEGGVLDAYAAAGVDRVVVSPWHDAPWEAALSAAERWIGSL